VFLGLIDLLDHAFARIGLNPEVLPLRKIRENSSTTLRDGSVVSALLRFVARRQLVLRERKSSSRTRSKVSLRQSLSKADRG
jgi:hypothetical protein